MSKNYLERINEYKVNEDIFKDYLVKVLTIIDNNIDYFEKSFQHVSVGNKYPRVDIGEWTASFFPGMVLQSYYTTKNEKYLRNSRFYLDSFDYLVENGKLEHHDIGFLYTLTCVALYKLTDDKRAREIALKAADKLMLRYNEKGQFIQAWGPMGLRYPDVKIIIDCMMNLPLLYWASEETGNGKYKKIAKKHALTSSKTLIREDGSVYHTYMFDPISGRAIEGGTHQGKYAESTWARGQAWALYGFTLSYMYTRDEVFLDIAKKVADYYMANLPADLIHYWDFSVSDVKPEMKDSSAASIGACGLFELSAFVEEEKSILYNKCGKSMIQQLCEKYFFETNALGYGLLTEGFYNVKNNNECTSWGDYFFVEALCTITNRKERVIFW